MIVVLIDGLRRSSRASEWYNLDDADPGFDKKEIIRTMIPKPPTHCWNALKNSMLYGNISTSGYIVIPLPVNADMLSKMPSIMFMPVTKWNIKPPIMDAYIQITADVIIPCFRPIFLCLYLSNDLQQIKPTYMDAAEGARKYNALHSRYRKSTIMGTRHINPIPTINIPEFLAMINKSCLFTNLIYGPQNYTI